MRGASMRRSGALDRLLTGGFERVGNTNHSPYASSTMGIRSDGAHSTRSSPLSGLPLNPTDRSRVRQAGQLPGPDAPDVRMPA